MTVAEVVPSQLARTRVDRIKTGVEVIWSLIVESYQARDWEALGYGSWDEMCTREFGTSRLRLPREERAETVQSLRSSGLSLRAIEAATGVSVTTVRRELAGVPNGTPDAPDEPAYEPSGMDEFVDHETDEVVEPLRPITGMDGKQYAPPTPAPPKRKSLSDAAQSAGWELRKAVERIERIVCDDRFRQNAEQVALALRGHLSYAADTVAAVADQLPSTEGV